MDHEEREASGKEHLFEDFGKVKSFKEKMQMNSLMFEGKGKRAKWRIKLKMVEKKFLGVGMERILGTGREIDFREEHESTSPLPSGFWEPRTKVVNVPKGQSLKYGHGFPFPVPSTSPCIFHAINLTLGEREMQEREAGPQKIGALEVNT